MPDPTTRTPAQLPTLPTSTDRADPPPSAGRFELVVEIARGGMGVVYRARDGVLGRDVAVKVLADRYPADSAAARRFLDEARIAGQLQHPGIPAVHDLGTLSDGRPFLAMKLIKGDTLADLLAGRPDPGRDRGKFLAIFEQVCQAIAYAHAHHVIHRDLKPANVMVGSFGEVQVMDWGLAKVLTSRGVEPPGPDPDATIGTEVRSLRGDDQATQAGSLLGTPAFMPPEQAIGAVDRIDARSDVFGLGAILCVVLTGKPPYLGADSESTRQLAARAKLDDALARLDRCGAEPELVALCRRCLSAEPDDRPADAGAVADAVAGVRAAAEDRARRAEVDRAAAEVKGAEERKRRRVQLALAGAVLLLLAGGGAAAWWADRQAAEKRQAVEKNEQAAEIALDQAEQALRRDNPVYGEIDAALVQAERRLTDGGPDHLRERLADLTKARRMLERLDRIDARRWEIAVARPLTSNELARTIFPAAFREYGLDLDSEPSAILADRVRRSPIATRLAAALDDWLEAGGVENLLDLIRHLDPDPERTAVRRDLMAGDQSAIAGWVGRADGRTLPPSFVAFVGRHPLIPQRDALRLLKAAQAAHPTDFRLAALAAVRSEDHPDDQIAYYRIALAIRPANLNCRVNLGHALLKKGDVDGAIAAYREAIHLDPKFAPAQTGLGYALESKGDWDGATAAYWEAVQLDPKDLLIRSNLGYALERKGDVDGAVAAYREAVRLDPKFAPAQTGLGSALERKGDVDGATAAYREAIRLDPTDAIAYRYLSGVLARRGEPRAALQLLQQGARVNPAWLTDLSTGTGYNLACYACLVAAGQGQDAPPPPNERSELRRQALGWLTADLDLCRNHLTADPATNRQGTHDWLKRWLADPDFASVRHPIAVGLLPADEREGWRKLWADIRRLRNQTAPPESAPPPRPVRR